MNGRDAAAIGQLMTEGMIDGLSMTLDTTGERAAAYAAFRERTSAWSASTDGMLQIAFNAGWRARGERDAQSDAHALPTREASAGERWARNAREIADALRSGHPAVDPAWIATILEECAALIPPDGEWRDRHGDIWTLGDDGLMHTPETAPFTREHVERKWGPLVRV